MYPFQFRLVRLQIMSKRTREASVAVHDANKRAKSVQYAGIIMHHNNSVFLVQVSGATNC